MHAVNTRNIKKVPWCTVGSRHDCNGTTNPSFIHANLRSRPGHGPVGHLTPILEPPEGPPAGSAPRRSASCWMRHAEHSRTFQGLLSAMLVGRILFAMEVRTDVFVYSCTCVRTTTLPMFAN